MKKSIFPQKVTAWIFLAMLALIPASCSDDDDPVQAPPSTDEQSQTLGTYYFDGESIPILTAFFTETNQASDNDGYYSFVFSPQSADGTISTRLLISIRKYWADGEPHEVGGLDLDHNDDYIIIYEDPVRYFSQYREPQGGTFCISVPDDRNGQFSVKLDVRLADGTPLAIDYTGKCTTYTEN